MTGIEDPLKRAEREAIQRDARQVARTYRALDRVNGIANTTGDARDAWRERVTLLEGRRDAYRAKWNVSLPSERLFEQTDHVTLEWLQAMVDALDTLVWQLDHEF